MNPSPLRYPGGKHRLTNYVRSLVKLNNCTTYIEPFCGGAAIALELLLDGTVNRIILNDYDKSIYCFWNSIINDTDAFIDMINSTEVTINEWHHQKEIKNDDHHQSDLEVGFATFFLNRTNRSGIIDKAGPIGGLSQNGNYLIDCRFNKLRLIQQIVRIAEHRDQITVYNKEAMNLIQENILRTRGSFTYFDPPYFKKGPGLYSNFYDNGDHKNLSEMILKKMKNRKWIVTYDNVNEIKSLYKTVNSLEFNLQYTLQDKRKASEVMFFFFFSKRLEDESQYLDIIELRD